MLSESQPKDFSGPIGGSEFAEDYGYLSDSDLEEDWDFESAAPRSNHSQHREQDPTCGQYKEHTRMGNVIVVQDVAFITYVTGDLSTLFLPSQKLQVSGFPALSVHRFY